MGDQGIDYDIMTGVSVGALNIAGLAQTPKGQPKEAIAWMENFWRTKVNTGAIYKRWFPFGRLHSLWLQSVYNSAPLAELVRANLDLTKVATNGRKIALGAVCLDTGEYRYATETDPDFVKWVLASSSFPVFLQPIEINGQLWSDGGIKHVTPLGQAIRMGADEIDVIMCSKLTGPGDTPWETSTKHAIPDQVLRAVDLMSDQIINNDIELTGLKNDLADIDIRYRKVRVRVVMPKGSLIANALDFDPAEMARLIDLGYQSADDFVELT
jgi:predicted patatin/cPLA2 family phospholipase